MTEYESCYVFVPETVESEGVQRASKRRKISKAASRPDSLIESSSLPFVPLLSGTENSKSVKARLELFEDAWSAQETFLHDLLEISNVDSVANVASFIHAVDFDKTDGHIPAGLIVAGSSIATDAGLFGSILSKVKLEERVAAVNLGFTQTTNVKSTLKHITKYATDQNSGSNDEESGDEEANDHQQHKGLRKLQDYVKACSIKKVILSFQDSEAFEGKFLSDLIHVLKSWIERIPFVLLFGVSTSIDIFKDKVSLDTASQLQSVVFNAAQVDTEELFRTAASEKHVGPCLGPGLSRAIIHRRNDQVKSVSSFSRALKYVHMTHFFANPLSIFLNPDIDDDVYQPEHYEAVRNLSSFQKYVERLIENDRNPKAARELLTDDISLKTTIRLKIAEGRKSLRGIIEALQVISTIQSTLLSNKKPTSWPDLYISGMAGKLLASTLLRETLLQIKKLRSNTLHNLLTALSPLIPSSLTTLLSNLETLTSSLNHPLRSSHEINNKKTLRTTIVASKVELSAATTSISAEDASYSALVECIFTALREFFETALINPANLFMHEVLIHELKSPHRDAFAPKPRVAIERALSSPHDYLGCECCEDPQLMGSQPATAVLYQLYLESGSVINVADLWTAFLAIVGDGAGSGDDVCEEEGEGEEQEILALFERAVAELKYLGMIKNSRKKVDHVAKLLWKGL